MRFVRFWMLLFCLLASSAFGQKIVLATGEFPPLNSESLKHFGLIPKIVTEAFALEGVEVEYQFYPWARAYRLSADGEVDGTAQWYLSEEREAEHFYSDPLMSEDVVWFHLKSHPFEWDGLDSLQDLEIGAIYGYTYTPEFYQAIEDKKLSVDFVSTTQQNFDKMLAKRIDIYPESIDAGYYKIFKTYPIETAMLFTNNPKPFMSTHSYLLLSRKIEGNDLLMEKFNRGLKELRDTGRYDELLLESRQGAFFIK